MLNMTHCSAENITWPPKKKNVVLSCYLAEHKLAKPPNCTFSSVHPAPRTAPSARTAPPRTLAASISARPGPPDRAQALKQSNKKIHKGTQQRVYRQSPWFSQMYLTQDMSGNSKIKVLKYRIVNKDCSRFTRQNKAEVSSNNILLPGLNTINNYIYYVSIFTTVSCIFIIFK